ncbi:uncharacterized protein LAJ45_00135 [Morchella importuna]|uniref:uncharacterized protein n=1 Tax=Morchella importuna TaxID=1174673 RepID=UPI001E8E269E|nr:uncharacterized protein LAJ45_00135 [Morchella importuna]KAH8155126.1 hypothetical protein LAJ45_00135 [Morchella importuna]
MAIKRIHFLVHGSVQGVFYRKFAVDAARKYSLTGFVRNIPNGKVEGEAQGEENLIRQFVKDLDKGPELANVIRVDQNEKEVVDGETEFRKVKNPR